MKIYIPIFGDIYAIYAIIMFGFTRGGSFGTKKDGHDPHLFDRILNVKIETIAKAEKMTIFCGCPHNKIPQ